MTSRKTGISGAIRVYSLDHARAAAVAAVESGRPVTLVSPPRAAETLGAAWFDRVALIAAEAYPEAGLSAIVDCSDKPGYALAALRQGHKRLIFTGRGRARLALIEIAARRRAEVITRAIDALDLLDVAEPRAACLGWLGARRAARPGHGAARGGGEIA